MAKRSERVARMIENFIYEWLEGRNIPEIAQKYRVTPRTIYERLQEIADNNGVKREELLERPHKKHKKINIGSTRETVEIEFSPEEIQQEMDELIAQTKLTLDDMTKILKEDN